MVGHLAVEALDTDHVLTVLEPIWRASPETADRVRGRIELILDYAEARGWRGGEKPTPWRGRLDHPLSHAVGNWTEAAYQRGDLLEKRRRLMAAWTAFCTAPEPTARVVAFLAAA